tara:strand:- start:3 stop:116 length:114 start_codon:yes stop_codon:yes gene_type:complete
MIVIKDGKNFAKIYASTAFDKWGVPTFIFVCTWSFVS